MTRNLHIDRWIILAAGVLLIAALVGCRGSGSGCVDEEIERVGSPAGTLEAVVYVRRCGATTSPGLNVSLLPHGHAVPDESGNVLVIHDPAAQAASGADVDVRWMEDGALRLTYGAGRRVSRAVPAYRGTRIEIRTRAP